MGIFILLSLVSMFSLGDSECIKVVKYAVKILQNSAGICIIMVSSVCGIASLNKQVCEKYKQVCETRYQLSEWPENTFLQADVVLISCNKTCFG